MNQWKKSYRILKFDWQKLSKFAIFCPKWTFSEKVQNLGILRQKCFENDFFCKRNIKRLI